MLYTLTEPLYWLVDCCRLRASSDERTGTASSPMQVYFRREAVRRGTYELSGDRNPVLKVERVIVLGRGVVDVSVVHSPGAWLCIQGRHA